MLLKDDIEFLIVHCSDTSDNEDIGTIDIHKMHLEFGWDGIGYHKIILRNGKIENGRPEFWQGAHVRGINHKSLGVCLIGRKKFTSKQFLSLKKLLLSWKSKYPSAIIKGHRDAVSTHKTCPNFDVIEWCKKVQIHD